MYIVNEDILQEGKSYRRVHFGINMDWELHNTMMATFPFQMLYDTISDPASASNNTMPAATETMNDGDGTIVEENDDSNDDRNAQAQALIQTSVSLICF